MERKQFLAQKISTRRLIKFLKSKASPLIKFSYINALRGVPLPHVVGEQAQLSIANAIRAGGQLVARVGGTEGAAVTFFLRHRLANSGIRPPYSVKVTNDLKSLSGFFPCTAESIDTFA